MSNPSFHWGISKDVRCVEKIPLSFGYCGYVIDNVFDDPSSVEGAFGKYPLATVEEGTSGFPKTVFNHASTESVFVDQCAQMLRSLDKVLFKHITPVRLETGTISLFPPLLRIPIHNNPHVDVSLQGTLAPHYGP